MILDAVRCGGRSHKPSSKSPPDQPPRPVGPIDVRSECEHKKPAGSDRLSELLRLSESSENEEDVRQKVQMLEELKRVVKRLQSSNVLEGAKEVRRLTKEVSDARTTLALLGAIPPLMALLDSEDSISQIAALYALLNLAIGNDA